MVVPRSVALDTRTNALAFLRDFARIRSSVHLLGINDIDAMNETQRGQFIDAILNNYTNLTADQKSRLGRMIRNSRHKDSILAALEQRGGNNAAAFARIIRNQNPVAVNPTNLIDPVEFMTRDVVDTIFLSDSSYESNNDYERRRTELNALFTGENNDVSYETLREYLSGQADWLDSPIVQLFARHERITKDQFVNIIRRNVLAHNSRRNDTVYCQNMGLQEGIIFQRAETFYRFNLSEARDLVTMLDRSTDNNNSSEIRRILRRAKALDGNPNNWSDREIMTAYIALALRFKDDVMADNSNSTTEVSNTPRRLGIAINHERMCEKYGINEDDFNDTRQVNGRLTSYTGNPNNDPNYVRWNAQLTNDDWFIIRDLQGNQVTGLGYVDVRNLWIQRNYARASNTAAHGTLIRGIVRIAGRYYEITIRDNRTGHGSQPGWRYVNGSESNRVRINDSLANN